MMNILGDEYSEATFHIYNILLALHRINKSNMLSDKKQKIRTQRGSNSYNHKMIQVEIQ